MNLVKSAVAVSLVIGAALGIGGYTFIYAEGASYLTDSPEACANCHVMDEHYAAWTKSSHRSVATCNDCHTPHDNIAAKYLTKARAGFRHASAFTLDTYPDRLLITESSARVTEGACRHCHESLTAAMDAGHGAGHEGDEVSCVRCHADVGHGVR